MTSGIIEILTDSAEVIDLVGMNKANDKPKVYPMRAPQSEDLPYVIVAKTGNDTGSQGKEIKSTLDRATYDVLCYAKNFRLTEELHEACRNALDNKASVTDVCEFVRIYLVSDVDRFDNNAEAYVHIATYGAEQRRTT